MTRLFYKIVVFSSVSVTPIHHHTANTFRHDVWVCYNQFQQSKYSNSDRYKPVLIIPNIRLL